MHRIAWLVLAMALALFAGDANDELLEAARRGDLAAVKSLIEKGSAIEAKTSYGQTPLYLAARNGHEAVVQYLLDKGANGDVRDTFYKASMLEFVLERKHYGVAKMLIARGGNADEQLRAVVESGQADLVQMVIEKSKPSQKALDSAYEGALGDKQAGAIAELLKKGGAHEPAAALQVDAKVLDSYAGT
ncbi:MAG: ankyrin repeat domain-containing protein [Bryobacteraceae bacterium]|jgi:ankyrin repeat protein